MSSPQGIKPPPTTPSSKDSPTSNFFNNLSPITVTSSRLSSQAFDNADVPSPQPVFATPQNRIINSKLWKRFQTQAFSGPQKICLGDADLPAISSEYSNLTRQFIPIAASQSSNFSDKKYNRDFHLQEEVWTSPSAGVDEFLSIPVDDCEITSCSPGSFLGESDDLIRVKESGNKSSPKEVSIHVRTMKAAVNATNSMSKYIKHSEHVCTPDIQPNDVLLPQAYLSNSSVSVEPGKEFLVSNAEKCFNINAVDQNSPCQLEKNRFRKPSCQTVSFDYDEIEYMRKASDKKIGTNSFVDSVSDTQNDFTLDKMGSNHSCVRSNLNFRSVDLVDECPSAADSCLLGMQDSGQLGGIYETNFQMKDASDNDQIPDDHEDVSHHSRAMYKRLQFEDAEKKEPSTAYARNCLSLKSPLMSATTMTPSNLESPHASTPNTITSSGRIQMIQSQPGDISRKCLLKSDSSEQSKGVLTAGIRRTSGIGLHLNAIGAPGPMRSRTDMKMPMEGVDIRKKKFFHSCEVPSQPLTNMMVSRNGDGDGDVQVISNSDDSSTATMAECNNERHRNLPDSAPDCHSPLDVEPLDYHITPCSRNRQPSVEASKSEDSAQTSTVKKRKKAQDSEGQKRCNCKRSKCLKLYCDCFAAGMFCTEACACHGCSNNSENEGVVSSTRQLIEVRNPLAFAPKVVPANGGLKDCGENKHITPPSARHKRGCNCKKSKCLKKYCECYQAGVGCCLGCRCEGCKNAYGTKEAYGDVAEIVIEHQKPHEDDLMGEPSVKPLELIMESTNEVSNSSKCFTPQTPLAQGTSTNGIPCVQLPASYQPLLEPKLADFATLSSLESPTSTMNQRHCADEEKSEQFDSISALKDDSLSPGWSGFTDICVISPSFCPSPNLCGSSTSKIDQAKTFYTKLFLDRDALAGVSLLCSPSTLQDEGKLVVKPATSEPHYYLDDETPEILKEDRSPIKTVKASSPNQKRVSPPKRLSRNTGSSFSPGLKSGRKYVLHSIPQFPSLTPYRNNSKDKDLGNHSQAKSSK